MAELAQGESVDGAYHRRVTDRRQVPVETTEGWRPGPSGGERTLVVMAVIALVSGLLIVAGNLLPKDDAVAVASSSPEPTARPSRTPRPTPAPLDLVVESASPPPPPDQSSSFYGWIRAKEELQVVLGPQEGATAVGVLAAGELVSASEDPGNVGDQGWMYVERAIESGVSGWVATRRAGVDLIERFGQPTVAFSGSISSLAAGPDGFVGIGLPSGTSDAFPPPFLIHSADGADWKAAVDAPAPGLYPMAVAWGPAGWLLASSGQDGGTWFSTSPDGSQWTVSGTLRAPSQPLYPFSLVAAGAGYLFSTQSYDFGPRGAQILWFSPDGVNWHEVDPGLTSTSYLLAAMPGGFYAWADPNCCEHQAAFSADGLTWYPVAGGPQGYGMQLAAIGERWFAIETDRSTGAPRAWLGRVARGQLSWQRMAGSVAPFDHAAVTSLVSTGHEVIAFGWDRSTEEALSWTTTGSEWIRSVLPGYEGIPHLAAGGAHGVALLGHRPSIRGDDPVVWHRTPRGAWLPEPDPLIEAVPEPSAADCAPLPHDALAFVLLDRALAPFCHGDTTITFRAWSGRCEGCWGGGDGTYEPQWLAGTLENQLVLAPVESQSSWTPAILSPNVASVPAEEWLDAWLEVTGHFDDPLALTCRITPAPQDYQYFSGALGGINNCRQQFVVTAVEVVDGP